MSWWVQIIKSPILQFTNSPIRQFSVTEKEQQIDSAPLHPLEQLLLRAGSLQHIGLKPQPLGEGVLHNEIRLTLIADLLLHFHVQVRPDLLPDGQLRR